MFSDWQQCAIPESIKYRWRLEQGSPWNEWHRGTYYNRRWLYRSRNEVEPKSVKNYWRGLGIQLHCLYVPRFHPQHHLNGVWCSCLSFQHSGGRDGRIRTSRSFLGTQQVQSQPGLYEIIYVSISMSVCLVTCIPTCLYHQRQYLPMKMLLFYSGKAEEADGQRG